MKVKSQRDFIAGLMFIVVGVVFAIGALNGPLGTSEKPGPGYFPLGLGLLLALLGALVLFKSLTIETEDGAPIGPIAWRPLILVIGAVVLFGAALPRLGLVVALPLLVIVASLAADEVRWLPTLASAVLLTALCWLVFVKGLGLAMPVWPVLHGG